MSTVPDEDFPKRANNVSPAKQASGEAKSKSSAGKTQIVRVPWEHYSTYVRRGRSKFWLGVVAIALPALSWAICGGGWMDRFLAGSPGSLRYSSGTVSWAHAMIESDCDACHVPQTRMGGENWLDMFVGRSHASNKKCQSCHAGPPHHPPQRPQDAMSCVACHREHRGRNTSLVQTADRYCTECHTSLTDHIADNAQTKLGNVSGFGKGADHPEFRFVRENQPDPERLNFNHSLHMTPGLRKFPQSKPYTLADIPSELRQRYQKARDDGEAVQLDCNLCHQLERAGDSDAGLVGVGNLPRDSLFPARGDGRYFLPVVYELHCAACHSLQIDSHDSADASLNAFTLPHRLQPPQIRRLLETHFADEAVRTQYQEPQAKSPPLPGRPPDGDRKTGINTHNIAQRVAAVERELYASKKFCAECHFLQPVPESNDAGTIPQWQIEPTRVPAIWLENARFDHTAHRTLSCSFCHTIAADEGGSEIGASRKKKVDVLLPGVSTCAECHSPPYLANGRSAGGARHNCTECHLYHNGDHPLQGRGAAARGPGALEHLD